MVLDGKYVNFYVCYSRQRDDPKWMLEYSGIEYSAKNRHRLCEGSQLDSLADQRSLLGNLCDFCLLCRNQFTTSL